MTKLIDGTPITSKLDGTKVVAVNDLSCNIKGNTGLMVFKGNKYVVEKVEKAKVTFHTLEERGFTVTATTPVEKFAKTFKLA